MDVCQMNIECPSVRPSDGSLIFEYRISICEVSDGCLIFKYRVFGH